MRFLPAKLGGIRRGETTQTYPWKMPSIGVAGEEGQECSDRIGTSRQENMARENTSGQANTGHVCVTWSTWTDWA